MKIKLSIILSLFCLNVFGQTILRFNDWLPTVPAATDLSGAIIPVVQSGATKKASASLFYPVWGSITGTLSAQSDLTAALAAKIGLSSLSATTPLGYNSSTGVFSIAQANSTTNGFLSNSDWNTFNEKQSAITLTTTGSNGAATFVSNTLNIPSYTLAGLGGIGLTSLSGTSPLSYNNTTGAFTIAQANTSTNGYLSSTDWNTFNNKQPSGNYITALTGDVTYWSTASGATLTAANTIVSTTPNGLTFSNTWTASANSQTALQSTSVLTSRSNSGDAITDDYQTTTFNLSSTSIDANAKIIDVSYLGSGGITTGAANGVNTQVNSSPSGMTAGSYTNIAPSSTSGVGVGALFSISGVTATALPANINCTTTGSGYKIGETITFNASKFQGTLNGGGSGSGTGSVMYTIFSIGSKTLGSNASALRLIHRFPDVQGVTKQYITIADASGNIAGGIGKTLNTSNQNTINFYDRLGSFISSDGSLITFGRTINSITVNGGTIAGLSTNSITAAAGGQTYSTGTVTNSILVRTGTTIFSANNVFHSIIGTSNATVTGLLNTAGLGTITGGSGYTDGTYNNVPLTGGTGTLATANITASAGAVTAVSIVLAGTLYTPGDVLSASSANIGGTGSGFSVPVTNTDFTAGTYAIVSDNRTINDKGTGTSYYGFYSSPTYNITSTRSGSTWFGYYNPTYTALGSFTKGGIAIVPTGTLSGLGTGSPAATLDIRGNGSTNPALRIASGGTSTEYAFRVQQSDVTTDIFWIKGNGDTQIGLSTSKLGFFGTSAIAQPTTGVAASTFTANSGTAINDASTFDGYTIKQVVKALRNLGLIQ